MNTTVKPTWVGPHLSFIWVDRHRDPKCAPDPRYPNGKDVDLAGFDIPTCKVDLPCPAPRIGLYVITCHKCGMSVAATTAGRPDDPRSVRFPCKRHTDA